MIIKTIYIKVFLRVTTGPAADLRWSDRGGGLRHRGPHHDRQVRGDPADPGGPGGLPTGKVLYRQNDKALQSLDR